MPRRTNNEGSVYPKRDKSGEVTGWIADVGWPDGKRVKRSARTSADAEAARKELIAQRDADISIDAYRWTVATLADHYLAYIHEAGRAPGTIEARERHVNAYILPVLEKRLCADLGIHDLRRMVASVKKAAGGPSVPPAVLATFGAMVRWGHRQGVISSIDFLKRDEPPRYNHTRHDELTSEQVAALEAVCFDVADGAFWLLLLWRGMRHGEARGLMTPDIDRRAMTMRIERQARTEKGGIRISYKLKSRNSARTIPINNDILTQLDRQAAYVALQKAVAGDAWRDRGLLFPNPHGELRSHESVKRRWATLRAMAGLPKHLTPHVLRHTFVSRALRLGLSVIEVARLVGDKPETVLATYAHASLDSTRSTLDRLRDTA